MSVFKPCVAAATLSNFEINFIRFKTAGFGCWGLIKYQSSHHCWWRHKRDVVVTKDETVVGRQGRTRRQFYQCCQPTVTKSLERRGAQRGGNAAETSSPECPAVQTLFPTFASALEIFSLGSPPDASIGFRKHSIIPFGLCVKNI